MEEEPALLPELLNIIFGLVRTEGPPITRARLRCVSHALREADPDFTSPPWTSTHPDLAGIRREPVARRLFRQFCEDAAAGDLWERLPEPLSIRWSFCWAFSRLEYWVRLKWASHSQEGWFRTNNIVSVHAEWLEPDKVCYREGDEESGSSSYFLRNCLPSLPVLIPHV